MYSLTTLLATTLVFSSTSTAHLALQSPPQFMVSWNPQAKVIDYNNRDPLFPDGRNYPCMNGHVGMTEDSSVATWAAGSTQTMSLEGSTFHNGGSCQISLSYDEGKTFRVIHSYIGSCPLPGQSYSFRIPADAPSGLAIFSWSWLNQIGNREFYHKCTAVTIEGGKGKAQVAFSKRPLMFIANMASTSCKSIEGTDAVYPNPGPDVTRKMRSQAGSGLSGECGKIVAGGTSGASGTSGATGNSSVMDDGNVATVSPPNNVNALPVSSDGSCGAAAGRSCIPGSCCSQYDYCGYFDGHCKAGCQPAYGQCGASSGGSMPGPGASAGGTRPGPGESLPKPPGGGAPTAGIGDESSARTAISRPLDSLRLIFFGVVPGRIRA